MPTTEKVCLNQVFRPPYRTYRAGVGDCTICTPHPDNKMCKRFYELTLTIEDVKPKLQWPDGEEFDYTP